tara:strand:- start:17 stop:514 length:498 start_codon:yes stop_codon:yes gene_type:complete
MTKQESLDKIFNKKSLERKTKIETIIEEPKKDKYVLKFDGCSKGNPGPAGAGAVIYKNGNIFWKSAAYVGKKETNNVAEYVGMLIGLNEAVKKNIKEIDVYGDSLLVIKQMRKEYAVNSFSLKPYNKKAFELAKQIGKVRYSHIYRDQNALADKLANEGLLLANN